MSFAPPSRLLHPCPLSNGWGAGWFSLDRGLSDDLPSSAALAPSPHPGPGTCLSCRLLHSFTHVSFLHRPGDTRGRGASPPRPTTGPSPLCTSALGFDWALGQTLLHGPGGTGHRPTPTTPPPRRACFLPGALLAFVREQGTGSKALGYLPSAGAPVTGLLRPAFALASPSSGPLLPVRPGRAAGASHMLPAHPRPSLAPIFGVSQKLVVTLPVATLSSR